MRPPWHILPIIVFAQFCCTSLWFASNAILDDLTTSFHLVHDATAHLTSAVQLGFIVGTLLFAYISLADRYSSSKVFFMAAFLGALGNLSMLWDGNTMMSLLLLRGFTGFFLAGIYPVGMKIASDYYQKGLGKSLGFLVGALVLGTAFPHLLNVISFDSSWQSVVIATSGLSFFGGLILLLGVPDGPLATKMQQWDSKAVLNVFKNKNFRKAAIGYFGHMWELYAFWAFVPWFLNTYNAIHSNLSIHISLWSFIIIGMGSLGCIFSGYISEKIGVRKTALTSLSASGILCLFSPVLFYAPMPIFLAALMLWGLLVVADSPMFSTLVASEVSPDSKATALTIVNCIGFSITIISVQIVSLLTERIDASFIFVILAAGPIVGVLMNRTSKT